MNAIGVEILARLLDEHAAALTLYARQWCDMPEDVVQEAFVLLAKQPKAPENVIGWLYRVVRNGAISAARAANRRVRHETAAAKHAEAWFDSDGGQRLDAHTVSESLRQLPLEQRETIVARLWGGLGFEEIAQLTGHPTSTVHRWYHAGLAALRERFGESCLTKNSSRKT